MERFILGGYTRRVNKGISEVIVDTKLGKFGKVSLLSEMGNPTYLDVVDENFIFSVTDENGWAGVALFERLEEDSLVRVTDILTENVNTPCYVSFDPQRELVYSANYHQGFFEVNRLSDNGLEHVCVIEHEGSSVHPNQQSSHVHYVKMDLANRYLLVCDLGTDEVVAYTVFDNGEPHIKSVLEMKPGFGPRHLVQHQTLPIIYVVGELSNEVAVCRYDAFSGELSVVEYYPLLPQDYDKTSSASAIRLSQDGRFLYVSNRGHNSIVCFEVLQDGSLSLIQWVESGGKTPRDFNFSANEAYVVVGHQDDDVLSLFKKDKQTGKLEKVDETVAFECVCVSKGWLCE